MHYRNFHNTFSFSFPNFVLFGSILFKIYYYRKCLMHFTLTTSTMVFLHCFSGTLRMKPLNKLGGKNFFYCNMSKDEKNEKITVAWWFKSYNRSNNMQKVFSTAILPHTYSLMSFSRLFYRNRYTDYPTTKIYFF